MIVVIMVIDMMYMNVCFGSSLMMIIVIVVMVLDRSILVYGDLVLFILLRKVGVFF